MDFVKRFRQRDGDDDVYGKQAIQIEDLKNQMNKMKAGGGDDTTLIKRIREEYEHVIKIIQYR